MKLKSILIISLIITFQDFAFSQQSYPSLSPKGIIEQGVGNTNLKIEYERPSARNRKVFGELVPWNEVWRTGAGYCTKISFDKNVAIGKQAIEAGTYSLLTIPNKEEWIVILNTDTSLYGAYDYNPDKDVARFVVYPQHSNRYYETLTIDVDLIPNNAMIYVSWENTSIAFAFETSTDAEIEDYINGQLLTGNIKDYDEMSNAIDYLYFQSKDFKKLEWLAKESIKLNKSEFAYRLLMETYERQHYYTKAIEAAKKAIETRKEKAEDNDKYLARDIKLWEKHLERIRTKANKKSS
ncbi:DUF2911 domain-containing protein [Croceivirga thetidis]|uniref:DUF2911 domain-containing protein n=1 Tax=Croceivirga thetidis TaxID=2721623 RepID=A0ABX1GKN3_9FLAO|nr:DUF2911 domain-containing protein [Croceivirga thetidis]NKI30433.1 DUF2911 domain-containing protein [Croceivirga thetidis]